MNLQSLRDDNDDDDYGGDKTEEGPNFVSDADEGESDSDEEDTFSDNEYEDDLHSRDISSPQAACDAKLFEQYHTMIDMTLELVRDITIVKKGRTPALRHLHRTHCIILDWLIETCQQDHCEMEYVETKETRISYFLFMYLLQPKI